MEDVGIQYSGDKKPVRKKPLNVYLGQDELSKSIGKLISGCNG